MTSERVFFGEFELCLNSFDLYRGVTRIKLERIPMEVLLLLARNNGRVVQRPEIIKAVWGKDRFVETDSAINTAVRKLRHALGDDPKHPRFIETVAGRGYRLLDAKVSHAPPPDAKALYARGLHFWNRKTPEGYVEAVRLYQQSIDTDPEYALPYLGLAKTWILFGIHGIQPAHEVYPRARAATIKALELDGSLAEGYAATADIVKGYDWNWEAAENLYVHALELNPQSGLTHQWYANLLSIVGRHGEALNHALQARALEPLSVGPAGFVAFTLLRARRYPEALRESQNALTLEPASPIANWFLGQVLAALERYSEAATVLSRAVEQSGGASMYLSALGAVHAAMGNSEAAVGILDALQRRAQETYISPLDLAIVAMALRRTEWALKQMATAVEQRVMRLTELAMPAFDSFRSFSEFQTVVAGMAFPEAASLTAAICGLTAANA